MTILYGGNQVDVFHIKRVPTSGENGDLSNYLLGISQQATTSTSTQILGHGYDFKTNTGYNRFIDTGINLNTTEEDSFEINIEFIPLDAATASGNGYAQYVFNPSYYKDGVWFQVYNNKACLRWWLNENNGRISMDFEDLVLNKPVTYNIRSTSEGILGTIIQEDRKTEQLSTYKAFTSTSTYRILGGISHDRSATGFYVKDKCWIKKNNEILWLLKDMIEGN